MKRLLHSKKTMGLAGATLVAVGISAVSVAVGMGALRSQNVPADFTNIHFRVVNSSASDFDSGWHIHPGLAIVQVREGSFQITQGSCTPKTVGPGETYIEVPYLPVRAVATGNVVWTTTLLVRYEDPPLIPVTSSPCP